ncbi:MAG: hypothetical protein HY814_10885, partial [Candidatus Riflebacteria bacterium]|nr:hypothetical protein [Candidatus Riflebacteria bacterium]
FALAVCFWPVLVGSRAIWFRDVFDFSLPIAQGLGAAWRGGEMGLWQPGLGMGYPILAEPAAMALYPPGALLAVYPTPWLLGLLVVLHLGLAGTGTFALLLAWRSGRSAAAFGAAVMVFCGVALGSTTLASLTRTISWLPWALLGFERFLSSGRARPLAGGSAALAMLALSSDHAALAMAVVLVSTLPWWRPQQASLRWTRVLAGQVLFLVLALGLAAAALLPAVEFTWLGGWNRLQSAESASASPGPLDLLNLLVARPYQDPQSVYFLGGFRDWLVPLHLDLYVGIGVLVLALAALGGCQTRWQSPDGDSEGPDHVWRLGWLAGGCLVASTLPRWAGGSLLAGQPMLASCCGRLVVPAMLALAALATFGLERLWSGRRRAWWVLGIGSALLGVSMVLMLTSLFGHGTELLQAYLMSSVRDLGGGTERLLENLRDAVIRNVERVCSLAVALAVTAWAALSGRLSGRTAAVFVGLLALGDLVFNTQRGLATVELDSVPSGSRTAGAIGRATAGTPRARFLAYPLNELVLSSEETALVRAGHANDLLTGCRGLAFGLKSTIDFAFPGNAAQMNLTGIFREAPGRAARDRLAGRLGAAVAVSCEGLGNATGSGPVVVEAGPVVARRILDVGSRVFIAPRAVAAAPGSKLPSAAALEHLTSEAVYEPVDGQAETLVPRRVRRCDLVTHGRDHLVVDFDLEGAGLLVVLESWSTGWRARVDGVERPVVRVAGLIRGVEVCEGERRVELSFEPLSVRLGLALSGLTLLLVLALGLRGGCGPPAPAPDFEPVAPAPVPADTLPE